MKAYLTVEGPEIYTEQDEDHSEDVSQHYIVDFLKTEYRQRRDHHKGTEYRHYLVPVHIPVHANGNINGVAHRQETCQGSSLSIRRHKEWQHGHNEDAEAETRRTLDEACNDAKKEYGENDSHGIPEDIISYRAKLHNSFHIVEEEHWTIRFENCALWQIQKREHTYPGI